MDTLPWIELNNSVKIDLTKKLFFNRYLYRVTFRVIGARIAKVASSPRNIEEKVENRILWDKRMKEMHEKIYEHSTRQYYIDSNFNIEQLIWWNETLRENKDLHSRIEEPNLSIYSNDCNQLLAIAQQEPSKKTNLISVSLPESPETIASLNAGKVLVKKIKGYTHKVIIKDNYCENKKSGREQVLDYLESLGEEVRLPPSCKYSLQGNWAFGSYFYCRDPSIVTFIEMICPGTVTKIFELEHLGD